MVEQDKSIAVGGKEAAVGSTSVVEPQTSVNKKNLQMSVSGANDPATSGTDGSGSLPTNGTEPLIVEDVKVCFIITYLIL